MWGNWCFWITGIRNTESKGGANTRRHFPINIQRSINIETFVPYSSPSLIFSRSKKIFTWAERRKKIQMKFNIYNVHSTRHLLPCFTRSNFSSLMGDFGFACIINLPWNNFSLCGKLNISTINCWSCDKIHIKSIQTNASIWVPVVS